MSAVPPFVTYSLIYQCKAWGKYKAHWTRLRHVLKYFRSSFNLKASFTHKMVLYMESYKSEMPIVIKIPTIVHSCSATNFPFVGH